MFERKKYCKSFSCWFVTNDDVYNHTELRCDLNKASHHITSQQSITPRNVHHIKLSIFRIQSFPEKKRKPSSEKCFQIKCWRVHPATKCFIKVSFSMVSNFKLYWNKTHHRTNPLIDFQVFQVFVCDTIFNQEIANLKPKETLNFTARCPTTVKIPLQQARTHFGSPEITKEQQRESKMGTSYAMTW